MPVQTSAVQSSTGMLFLLFFFKVIFFFAPCRLGELPQMLES